MAFLGLLVGNIYHGKQNNLKISKSLEYVKTSDIQILDGSCKIVAVLGIPLAECAKILSLYWFYHVVIVIGDPD